MGRKILYAGNGVAIFAVMGYFICLFLPLHKVYFKSIVMLGGSVLDISTKPLTVNYDWQSTVACKLISTLTGEGKKGRRECNKDNEEGKDSLWLQDVQATFCQTGVDQIMHSACAGFSSAYVVGVCYFLVVLLNIIGQGVSLWLIMQYMSKPKKQYREVAFFLDLIGVILVLIVALLYQIAMTRLSSINLLGFGLALGASEGIGVSIGYMLIFFFVFVQGISVVLLSSGSNSAEAREAKLREQRKFMQEMAMFDQSTEMTNYPGQGVSAPPAHWQTGPPQNWGGQQAYPQMPAMTQPYGGMGMGMQPQMQPQMQMGGSPGPYF